MAKRAAEIQINREELENNDEVVDEKIVDGVNGVEKWQKAPDEILAERRILKPKLHESPTPSDLPKPTGFLAYKTNPFATLGTSAAPSFQASPSSPKPNPFSSQNPPHNPFMSFDNKGFEYWGSKKSQTPPTPNEPTPLFSPPQLTIQTSESELKKTQGNTNLNNTHHNDDHQEDNEEDGDGDGDGDGEGGGDQEDPEADGYDDCVTSPNNSISNGEGNEECLLRLRTKLFRFRTTAEMKSEWVEMGTGPLKLLRPAPSEGEINMPSRIVMRRENDRRGSGTKLLVNLLLSSTATVGRQAEKAVRLTCFIETSVETKGSEVFSEQPVEVIQTVAIVPTSYLFKTDSVENTDKLLSLIEGELRRCKSTETKAALSSQSVQQSQKAPPSSPCPSHSSSNSDEDEQGNSETNTILPETIQENNSTVTATTTATIATTTATPIVTDTRVVS